MSEPRRECADDSHPGSASAGSASAIRDATRARYRAALEAAIGRSVAGDPGAALDAFLTLNAGYFLGAWLSARAHAGLIRRLAPALTGLADLPLPADPVRAAQLAQHVRELAVELGPIPWTETMAARTAALVPKRPKDWDAAARAAAGQVAASGDPGPLLLAHARRRLWALAQPVPTQDRSPAPPAASATVPVATTRRIARASLNRDGRTIQLAEVALTEIDDTPALLADLLPALRTIGLA